MAKVIVCNIVSLDGYYEGLGGNIMVLPMDEAFDAYNRERIEAAGTVLLGRRSFQGFSSYWPGVAEAPTDPDNRTLSDDNRALTRVYNRVEKVRAVPPASSTLGPRSRRAPLQSGPPPRPQRRGRPAVPRVRRRAGQSGV